MALIRGELGFKGLLLSDDISMKAMGGSLADRARAALGAGCDVVLHCNASLAEKQEAIKGIRALEGAALERADIAMRSVRTPKTFDVAEARHTLDGMLANYA
jgi:beta-N-acetylhexosaminidase